MSKRQLLIVSSVSEPPLDQALLRHNLINFDKFLSIVSDPSVEYVQEYTRSCSIEWVGYSPNLAFVHADSVLLFWKLGDDTKTKIVRDCNLKGLELSIEFVEEVADKKEPSQRELFFNEQEAKFMRSFEKVV